VKWEKVNATLPKDITPEDLTMEQALGLIAEKAAKPGKSPKSGSRKAAPKKKASAKRKT
jgi:DNA topoisomerase-1